MIESGPIIVKRCIGRRWARQRRRDSLLGLVVGIALSAVAAGGCFVGSEDSQDNVSSVQWNRCIRALDRAERTFADAPYRQSAKIDVGYVLVEEAWAAAEPCLGDVDEVTRVRLAAEYTEAQRIECAEVLRRAERILREASVHESATISAGSLLLEAEPVTIGAGSSLLEEERAAAKPCLGISSESSFARLEASYARVERELCLTILSRAVQLFDEAPLVETGRIDAGYVFVEEAWAAAESCLGYADQSAREWLEAGHSRAQRAECVRVLGRALQIYDNVLDRGREVIEVTGVVELTQGQLENAKSASEPCLRWADEDYQRSLSAKSDDAFAVLPDQVNRAKSSERRPNNEGSTRPAWCRHYDAWERAFDEAERLKARNSEFTADWSEYDLLLLEGFTDEFISAANQMWATAPASEDWSSAHRKCR